MVGGMNKRELSQPSSIDEVIEHLDEIIRWSIDEGSRVGYFAALYRGVTEKVRDGIAGGRFEDPDRMERFDIAFAARYLDAVSTFRAGGKPTRSWRFALESAGGAKSIVLQHLLLGINAHINLDLGVAAAAVSKGSDLGALQRDFDAINDILAARVAAVRAQIDRVSPLIFLLGRVDPTADRAVVNFSIERARRQAWTVAELLACLDPAEWPERIDVLDRSTTSLARLIRDPPGWVLNTGLRTIRLAELRSVRRVIDLLRDPAGEGVKSH
jgi:Family of unknown function (DUF5995)